MTARSMTRSAASALAIGAADTSEGRPQFAAASSIAGQAGSPDAMARLRRAIDDLKALGIEPMLRKSVAALLAEDAKTAADWAIKALERDERCGMAWYCLAIAREKAGDFKSSIQCYESALALAPDHAEIANNLGRLAYRMGMRDFAEKFFRHYLAQKPESLDAANNLACCLRDQHRYSEAVDALRPAIQAHPDNAMLWNTLGTVLTDQGELESALTFFNEALRLDPRFSKALYNRSTAQWQLGDPVQAVVDCETALTGDLAEHERSMMRLARSTMLIAAGDLAAGWDGYEERLSHHYADATQFLIDRPRWTPEADLAGRSLLLCGEQGLGDEVLFANIVPDVIESLGPRGKLTLAVEKRLVSLFQRSFPSAEVGAHATYHVDVRTVRAAPFIADMESIDLWAPLASPLRRYRRSVGDFPNRPRFLVADPDRVAHWREVLRSAPQGRKVGVLWKSLKLDGARLRYFSPFEAWRPVLTTPGVVFVNLQYGDCRPEIAQAAASLGVALWTPPGIDLKDDLDDLAALTCALDLIIGPANATTNIAAACGAPVWLISTPAAWPKLGAETYPWYPQARVFNPPAFNEWEPVMHQIASALNGTI